MIDKATLITDFALEDRTILSVQTLGQMDIVSSSSVLFLPHCLIFLSI